MGNSLSRLASSAENCVLEEWVRIAGSPLDERIVRMNQKCDPLTDCVFPGIKVACVCGYRSEGDSQALVYFWCEGLGVINYDTLPNKKTIRDLIGLAVLVRSVSDSPRPSFQAFRVVFESQLASLFGEDSPYLKDRHLYWAEYDELVFVSLFSVADFSDSFSAEAILNCIDFHNDYFRVKSPVWNSAPMSFLFDRVQKDADLVARLLLEPRCFNPFKDPPRDDWFLWPWQRSMRSGPDDKSIRYSPIETTSLVFDLRKSTMALEQLRVEDVGLFSGFIKEVMAVAKKAVFDQGGFFDKETGDGIVAHFADFALPGVDIDSASLRAFNAAKALIGDVRAICGRFQDKLRMGVGGLGASVGLHSGKAVWICENNLVSAIGESVIMAARLCAEADNFSVFLSNFEFQKLAESLPGEDVSNFERKDYLGKEYNDRSRLFGYMIRV